MADTITFVERCYDLALHGAALHSQLVEIAHGLLPASTVPAAYSVRVAPGERVLLRDLVSLDDGVVTAFRQAWSLVDRPGLEFEVTDPDSRRMFLQDWPSMSAGLLGSAAARPASLRSACINFPSIRDIVLLASDSCVGQDGCVTLAAGRERVSALAPAESARWLRLRAHLQAAVRLRRRFEKLGLALAEPTAGSAVIAPGGRVLEANGRASSPAAQAALRQAAIDVDRARSKRGGRGDEALSLWSALVKGHWSLVERFEADGRRLFIAHRNDEGVADPRGLTRQEARVCAFAARGLSNKVIAYSLGLATTTVATHLANAQKKLCVDNRIDLVRTLGPGYVDGATR